MAGCDAVDVLILPSWIVRRLERCYWDDLYARRFDIPVRLPWKSRSLTEHYAYFVWDFGQFLPWRHK